MNESTLRRAVEMLDAARRSKGISERKAAAAAGISDTWWRRVVADDGNPEVGTVIRMARSVGMETTVRGLLGRPAPVPNPDDPTEVAIMTSEELDEQQKLDAIEELREGRRDEAQQPQRRTGQR